MVKKMFDLDLDGDALELVRYNYKDDPRYERLELPDKFRFRRIRSIAPKAFSEAKHLKEVIVPDGTVNIGAGAFEYCAALESVALPPDIKIIDYNTFKCCASLRRIELPERAAVIRSFAFLKCVSLESVRLPEMLCVIYNGAFEDCASLREVSYPASEVTILGKAFKGCMALDTLPMMYTLIGYNDLSRPFRAAEIEWDAALRRDVFALAIEHGSFENVERRALFREIIDRGLSDIMPLAEGMLTARLAGEFIGYAAERGCPEISARLLNAAGRREETASPGTIEDIINEKFSL